MADSVVLSLFSPKTENTPGSCHAIMETEFGICNLISEYILGAAGTFIPWPGLEGKLGLGLGALFRARSAALTLCLSLHRVPSTGLRL